MFLLELYDVLEFQLSSCWLVVKLKNSGVVIQLQYYIDFVN